ncbi:MAG: methylated-DNA--[protein]-cysteine S-methyltransferase [Oscillospiraceae bacterium]|nr:methylated-DNA--[protein]-cysteine S-methyltransferase [Oscillospiraceae bacterium]
MSNAPSGPRAERGATFAKIYEIVKQIPPGKVATYGQIAFMAGKPRAARVVGWALHVNPDPEGTPCFRVVNRRGECSGSFAFGGEGVQRALLEADGVGFLEDGRVDLRKHLWRPGAQP